MVDAEFLLNKHFLCYFSFFLSIPINTIFDPHNNQTTSTICMSPDGKYLASVSNGHTCSFNLWKWSLGEQEPDGKVILKIILLYKHTAQKN